MKRFMILGLSLLMTLFMSCEDKDDADDEGHHESTSVTTSNVDEGAFYYNLVSASEDTTTWHVSLQNVDVGGGYFMPSIVLDSTVMIAIDNSESFDELDDIPDNSQWSAEIGILSYGGSNEVLSYDMTTHSISVSDDNYLVYVTTTHQVFKLHFDEYSSGVVQFRFAELTE